jgi:hypothetical protein
MITEVCFGTLLFLSCGYRTGVRLKKFTPDEYLNPTGRDLRRYQESLFTEFATLKDSNDLPIYGITWMIKDFGRLRCGMIFLT